MDRELEVIRDDMEQTRANLADKLGALEEQVRETVTSASETVTSTVEGVKEVVDTVSETVESVTETFNISKQVEQHPMLSMGVALATGFALSHLFGGSRQPVVVQQPAPQPPPPPPAPQPQSFSQLAATATPPPATPSQPRQQEQGWLDKAAAMLPSLGSLGSMLPSVESLLPDIKEAGNTVISGLTGLAVGSVMSVIRELVAKNLPQDWTGEINKLIDQATVQLGGKPQPVHQEQQQKQEQKGQEPQKHDGKQGEQKPQDRAQEQGRDNRSARNERRQPAHQG